MRQSGIRAFPALFISTSALTAAGALLAPYAAASPQIESEIIVEGLRLPTTPTQTGTSVDIISADEIELKGYVFAVDALAAAPGVTVNQNGPLGGLATVRIRGASSDQTLVLLDGVPIGDPTAVGGGYDFSLVDTSTIERIEILKGAQSTLWGSDAIGGVINIVTKTPSPGAAGTLFFEGGSYQTYRGGAAGAGANDLGEIRLSISGLTSNGISKADEDDGNTEADSYESLTLGARAGLNLPAGFRLDALAHFVRADTDIDGFPPPTFTLADSDDESETAQLTSAATLRKSIFDGRFTNEFTVGYTEIERTGVFGGFQSLDEGERFLLRYQGGLDIHEDLRLAFGAEREENEANDQTTSIDGAFALLEYLVIDGLNLSAGVRRDDHSDFGGETTARFSASWALNEYVRLRGSWGEGFKAPTIFQLTQSFGALPPNSDLQPETSDAYDVGVELAPTQKLQIGVTYFSRETENQIIFAPNFRYENLASTKAQGIEVDARWSLTPSLRLEGAYSFIDAVDRTTNERQIRLPRHSGDLTLSHQNDGPFRAAMVVRYNGRETEGAFGSDVDAWVRVDLSAAYQINEILEVYGRVENLLDADYQQVSGYGTPGRSAYGGARLSF